MSSVAEAAAAKGKSLPKHIEELESQVRAAGEDLTSLYKAAGIRVEDPHNYGVMIDKLRVLSFVLGAIHNGKNASAACHDIKLSAVAPASTLPRAQSAPPSRPLASENPIPELDRFASLVMNGKTKDAKEYLRAHRTVIIQQRAAMIQILGKLADEEKDQTKKYAIVKQVQFLRSGLPL